METLQSITNEMIRLEGLNKRFYHTFNPTFKQAVENNKNLDKWDSLKAKRNILKTK